MLQVIPQVSRLVGKVVISDIIMVGYERGILERLSGSQKKRRGRDSPLCETNDFMKDIAT